MAENNSLLANMKSKPVSWCAFGLLAVAAFLLGIFLPFEQHQWLALVLYVPLALVLRRTGPFAGFLAGMLFGVVGWAAGTWWLVNSMGSHVALFPLERSRCGNAGLAVSGAAVRGFRPGLRLDA